jgi:hypothetical protein
VQVTVVEIGLSSSRTVTRPTVEVDDSVFSQLPDDAVGVDRCDSQRFPDLLLRERDVKAFAVRTVDKLETLAKFD